MAGPLFKNVHSQAAVGLEQIRRSRPGPIGKETLLENVIEGTSRTSRLPDQKQHRSCLFHQAAYRPDRLKQSLARHVPTPEVIEKYPML